MSMNRLIRGIAGGVILVSILLGVFVAPGWLWLGGIISASLLQSAFTNWCPLMGILKIFSVKD